MVERTRPLSYGLPLPDEADDVSAELFPNSHSYLLGGCIMDSSTLTEPSAMVCDDCVKAEEAWRLERFGPPRPTVRSVFDEDFDVFREITDLGSQ